MELDLNCDSDRLLNLSIKQHFAFFYYFYRNTLWRKIIINFINLYRCNVVGITCCTLSVLTDSRAAIKSNRRVWEYHIGSGRTGRGWRLFQFYFLYIFSFYDRDRMCPELLESEQRVGAVVAAADRTRLRECEGENKQRARESGSKGEETERNADERDGTREG